MLDKQPGYTAEPPALLGAMSVSFVDAPPGVWFVSGIGLLAWICFLCQ